MGCGRRIIINGASLLGFAWLSAGPLRAADAPDARRAVSDAGLAFESARLLAGAPRVAALQDCERQLDEALRGKLDDPARGAAALLSGSIHFELGDAARATDDFKRAAKGLESSTFADDAALAQIQALEATGRDADAMREWGRWETRFPQSSLLPEARLAQAWNALRRGQVAEAEKRLATLVAAEPHLDKDARVVMARATADYLAGRPAQARTRLTGMSDAGAVYLRGLTFAAEGAFLKAAASFQEVADRHPHSPLRDWAMFGKADAFYRSRAY